MMRGCLDTCDDVTIASAIAHAARWPFPRNCRHHTPDPAGYIQWHEWARLMDRAGYSQITCQHCGLWAIWLPKKIANEIRRSDAKEQRRVSAVYRTHFEKSRSNSNG